MRKTIYLPEQAAEHSHQARSIPCSGEWRASTIAALGQCWECRGCSNGRKQSRQEVAETIGMTESMTEILRRHRWLGHVAKIEDSRMPKHPLLGELERSQLRHRTKRRWRDLMEGDVQAIGLRQRKKLGWLEITLDCYVKIVQVN